MKNRIEKFVDRIKQAHKEHKQSVFFICGPSSVGKDGLWKYIKKMHLHKKYNLYKPVSTTTRMPRLGETCGKDYYFMYLEQLINPDHTFKPECLNPIQFGKSINGADNYYCFTEQELSKPIKEGKSLVFILIGSAVNFYREWFREHFPHVQTIATCWTISEKAQRIKFFKRDPLKTKEELERLFQSRIAEREMYEKLIAENTFDFVDNADISLHDWKHKQYDKR